MAKLMLENNVATFEPVGFSSICLSVSSTAASKIFIVFGKSVSFLQRFLTIVLNDSNDVQPANAQSPMLSIVLGRFKEVRLTQNRNALSAIMQPVIDHVVNHLNVRPVIGNNLSVHH